MSEKLNLYQKLALIRKPVEVIQKNRQGYGYTYADTEAVLSKITAGMRKYHVSLVPGIIPGSARVEPYHYVKTKVTRDGTPYEEHVNEVLVSADTQWTWVNDEEPEEFIVVPWFTVGSQSDASQAFGSGLTYSMRYFLLQYFDAVTSDNDPDAYRRKQREAEEEEDRMIAEGIINQVHELVTSHLTDHPDDRQKIVTITKKFAKENGKASANYYAITEPDKASGLLDALRQEFEANKQEPKEEEI